MIAEVSLCKKVQDALNTVLSGIQTRGNWDSADDLPKGVDVTVGPQASVTVSPRAYDSFSGNVATFTVRIEVSLPIEDDVTLDSTLESYEATVGLLESWRKNITTAKTALATANVFDPVGVRLDGGSFEIDETDKTRIFNQQLTIKGRIL